ncbi:MAG: LLM class F420-dependent oxidoreductase, partial [Bacteroidetes bacterium]|nr:LLM class F420-dependent oxidoreductase [Bacteroidota bacterium]
MSLKPSWAYPKPVQNPHPPIILGAEAGPKTVADMAEFIRGCPRAEGVDEILLPGDPERKLAAQRTTAGIFLDEE